ncbi:o-succinylbenzoate synthase [Listeria costaricensis]|uniref:o-succinylbenzoate synthase n=1 Tax=Listeria costaricensis TaxID=2026604 RepID=UPI000C082A67|nr:o-succinylbenzoate synthase [Listeria costaricensis]
MRIKQVTLYHVKIPMVVPFVTSYGDLYEKECVLVEVMDEEGIRGYGELEAFPLPDYIEEFLFAAKFILEKVIVPQMNGWEFSHPSEFQTRFSWIRGNEMAKAAVESALWDLYAKKNTQSLQKALGGEGIFLDVGVSLGIQKSPAELVARVTSYVHQGYKRIKVKIKPDHDLTYIAAVREAFPEILLMADANSAYTLADFDRLKDLDRFQLAMIEQPFSIRDFIFHAQLQKQIQTPICLDENIRSVNDVNQAYRMESCRAINLKMARVGGHTEALKIINYCHEKGLIVWCGGMLEAGIGRAHNLALASRKEFNFPGDISATNRYFNEDIIEEEFKLQDGRLEVPQKMGIGVEISMKKIEKFIDSKQLIKLG